MNIWVRIQVLSCLLLGAILAGGQSVGQDNQVEPLSLGSLKLKILHDETELGSATGFLVVKNSKDYLITNRHVLLLCAEDRGATNIGGWLCANKLSIFHNRLGPAGNWFWVTEDLVDTHGQKRWIEHPTLAGAADVVALPLSKTDGVMFHDLPLDMIDTDIVVGPADSVSIVGFPFGVGQNAGLPIWKAGTVASDFATNVNGRPMFLVDTTARPGMSGSPVYAVRSGAYHSKDGMLKMSQQGPAVRFLGIYSEQTQAVEIGGVWKADVVKALYDSLP